MLETSLRAALQQIHTLAARGQIAIAAAHARSALDDAAPAPCGLLQATHALLEGVQQLDASAFEAGLQLALPAIGEVERSEHAAQLAWAHSAIGFGIGSLGDPKGGLAWVDRAIALTNDGRQPVNAQRAHYHQGALLGMVGEHDQAIDALSQALTLAQQTGATDAEADCLLSLAFTCLDRARASTNTPERRRASAARALACAEHARALVCGAVATRGCARGHDSRARALILLGDLAAARLALRDATAAAAGFPELSAEALHTAARFRLACGDISRARHHLDEGLALARTHGFEPVYGRLLEERVRVERAAGESEAALVWFERRVEHLQAQYQQRLQTLSRCLALQHTPIATAAG
jgi:tetratricopeptide (TPR) repeat protein